MLEIREEVMIFLLAVIAGAVVRLSYRCICCFRSIVRHSLYAVEIEDMLFWIGAAVYLFVQIYHTSDGSVRWYFVLGIVLGAVVSSIIFWKIEKTRKKIYERKRNKSSEKLAK